MGVSFEINGFGCGIGVILLYYFFFGRGRRKGGGKERGEVVVKFSWSVVITVGVLVSWCLGGLEAWLVVFSEVSLCH